MRGDPLAAMEARFMAAIAAIEEQVLAALGSLSGMAERLDAEHRRITALGERLNALENGRRSEEESNG